MFKMLFAVLFVSAALVTAGCDEPDDTEGVSITSMPLPADTVLNLNCAGVGVFPETCVLDDPENPFVNTGIIEFNADTEEEGNKFELANEIASGPSGAKSRFYFWATALARLPIGENQYYTALALHELYDAQIQVSGVGDPIVRDQALKAYRSVLDNFFSSVTFFACDFRDGVFQGCPSDNFDPDLDDRANVSFPLNETVADNLFRPDATGFATLADTSALPLDLAVLDLLSEWGYSYQPATPPAFNDGVIFVNDGG